MDKFCKAQFTNIDALRRVQGEALGLLGFGPNECDYHVILSGSHWRLRKYADYDGQSSLLIVPAPIKRPYIWDLAPSISVVRYCLDRHFGVYLLEWMPPLTNGKQAGLADYADRAISECVAKVSHESQGSRPFLIGHSLGGTIAAIYCLWSKKASGVSYSWGRRFVLRRDRVSFGMPSSPSFPER
jgi:polyhydroxyalkanoate synthase